MAKVYFYLILKEKHNERLSLAVIVTGCPFTLVEHPLWKEFFHHLRPSYKLPERRVIGNRYVDHHYQNMLAEVTQEVLHLQCDGWTNIRREGIINFVINKSEPVFVKSVAVKSESQTADFLKNQIEAVLNTYGLNKFMVLIGDNAAALQLAFQLITQSYQHIFCTSLSRYPESENSLGIPG